MTFTLSLSTWQPGRKSIAAWQVELRDSDGHVALKGPVIKLKRENQKIQCETRTYCNKIPGVSFSHRGKASVTVESQNACFYVEAQEVFQVSGISNEKAIQVSYHRLNARPPINASETFNLLTEQPETSLGPSSAQPPGCLSLIHI